MSAPPFMPSKPPFGSLILIESQKRKRRVPEGGPALCSSIPHRESFFVEQWIPVRGEPLKQWKQIPVRRISGVPRRFAVNAQILTCRPYLERTPRKRFLSSGTKAPIRIGPKRNLESELVRISR